MKKFLRIFIPIVLALAVVFCSGWYLLEYDTEFTRDILLSCARNNQNRGNHRIATWFYNRAYAQAKGGDDVAIELAQQYANSGNYTKAEYTLTSAISDGAGADVYIALCKTYVEQDKLLDAVKLLGNITNADIKAQLEAQRPQMPTVSPDPSFYTQYVSVTLQSDGATIYASTDGSYPSVKTGLYSEPIPLSEGETEIYAVAVAENGLVSPVSISKFTIGGVIEKVEFHDAAIETQVRTQLQVGAETELLTNALWTLTEFTVPADATDYTDLKHMIYLESLTIEGGVKGQIENLSTMSRLTTLQIVDTDLTQDDLKIIAALPQLKTLTLQNTDLSGIAPLSAATGLENLNISGNTVRNLDALKSTSQLKVLNAAGNAITEISALAGCTALTQLDISSNNITSLAPISGLTALTELNASVNQLSDVGDIGKLTSLTKLNLSKNTLASLGSLSGCTALTDLDVSSNALTELSCLTGIHGLMNLNFSHNQVTALPEFSASSKLVSINGSHNQLSSLSALGGLGSLNTVDMDYNAEISSVEALAECPVLIRVNVYGTKVTEVGMLTDRSIEVNYNPVQ